MKSQITIKKIQDLLIKKVQTIYVDDDASRRMWWASLEVIQKEFLSQNCQEGGIWVASPLPALNDKKFFNLDLGYGPFEARSMKRLEKARLHVQDEILKTNYKNSPIGNKSILNFYLKDSLA